MKELYNEKYSRFEADFPSKRKSRKQSLVNNDRFIPHSRIAQQLEEKLSNLFDENNMNPSKDGNINSDDEYEIVPITLNRKTDVNKSIQLVSDDGDEVKQNDGDSGHDNDNDNDNRAGLKASRIIIDTFRQLFHKYIDSNKAVFMINVSSENRKNLTHLFDVHYYNTTMKSQNRTNSGVFSINMIKRVTDEAFKSVSMNNINDGKDQVSFINHEFENYIKTREEE